MTTLRVYDIVNENGQSWSGDITVRVQDDFTFVDVFDEVEKACGECVDSYSYERLAE